jgi:hypothetical protein
MTIQIGVRKSLSYAPTKPTTVAGRENARGRAALAGGEVGEARVAGSLTSDPTRAHRGALAH